jgi:DNA-binding HxlR family transcriptional regulator
MALFFEVLSDSTLATLFCKATERAVPSADYGQYCAIARGLEIVGDRWTLLVVRELLTGARRFSHLQAGLPGVATNLLVERLQRLEKAGVVTRTRTEDDARGIRYELTPFGRELERVILPLARWASPLLGDPALDDAYHLRWFILTLRAQFDPAAASGPPRVYEFRVDDEIIHATVDSGRLDARDGPAAAPDVIVATDRETFLGWRTGRLSAREAIASGLVIDGGAPQLERLERLFPLTSPR